MNNNVVNEDGFIEFLNQIIEGNHIEGSALGIAKFVRDTGDLESLSSKQKYIFEKDIVDYYFLSECKRCGLQIPWSEMYDAVTSSSEMCSWCNQLEK